MDLEDVRKALQRRPFEPFTIRLADGRLLTVRHPDSIAVGKERIIVVKPDDSSMFVDSRLIVSLDADDENPPETNRQGKDET